MVYLAKVINKTRQELLSQNSIQKFCFFYVVDRQKLDDLGLDLPGPEEILAAKGYKSMKPDQDEILNLIQRKPIKGLDYSQNIYKLLGICLASGESSVHDKVSTKFESSSLRYKYLISKVLPEFKARFHNALNQTGEMELPYFKLMRFIYGLEDEVKVERSVQDLLRKRLDVIDLILLEELESVFIANDVVRFKYQNYDARETVRRVLLNFGNAVKKITRDRRKGHSVLEINDEYDVQDLLYVMLKPLFPKLDIEEPTPKVGPKYSKIDLIIKKEGIMIEVKMIKVTDADEKQFVEQLKNDIQSYYRYPFLKDLLVFVYDPQNKTKDVNSFHELNGSQEIQGVRFQVEVIVGN